MRSMSLAGLAVVGILAVLAGGSPARAEWLGYHSSSSSTLLRPSANFAAYAVKYDLPDPAKVYEVKTLSIFSASEVQYPVFPAGTDIVIRIFSGAGVPLYTSQVFSLAGIASDILWRDFDIALAHVQVQGSFYGGMEQRGTGFTFGFLCDYPSGSTYGRSYRYMNSTASWAPQPDDYMFNALVAAIVPPTWTGAVGDHFEDAANWQDGGPPGAGLSAIFGPAATNQPVLYRNESVKRVEFNSADWTVGGAFALTVGDGGVACTTAGNNTINAAVVLGANSTWTQASGGSLTLGGGLNIAGRTLTKDGAGTLAIGGTQDHTAGSVLNVTSGVLSLATDAGGTAGNCNLAVSASAASIVQFGATQHLAALNLGGTSSAAIATGGTKAIVTKVLTLAESSPGVPTSRLDLGDGNLTVDYAAGGASPLSAVRDWVRAGYNQTGGGDWGGQGITSSAAVGDAALLTAVGVLDNSDPLVGGRTTFEGQTVDASSVLVKYTYWGDANFDGAVTFDDYDIIDYYYWFPLPAAQMGWWTGDFDYDGNVDFDDYDKIDYAYWFQGAPLGGLSGVPEPATLALLALGACAALARRRR